ncbi:MAG: OadG family protein [Blautia sp.]|nr:OadG family protein [Blautia sp.]
MVQYLEQSLDSDYTSLLLAMTDEDIEHNIEYGDDFSKTAVEAWKSSKEELGERKADAETTVTVEVGEDKTYIATQNVQFEKHDADFIYTFDKNMTPTDLTINVNYPKVVTLQRAGLNTLMGLGTVFIMLIFLSFVISLFKYIPNGSKKKPAEEPAPAPVRAAAPEPEYVEETDDQELVAVIAAAIAAAEGTTPDGFVVRSIRRAGRSRR